MAAESARPYAERMERLLGNLGASMPDAAAEELPLLRGTGSDQVHLLVVATGERGLAGAFNSSIARLARDHANRLLAEGKEVKILCVGRKGADILRRQFPRHITEVVDLRGVRQVGYGEAEAIARKVLDMFEAGQFDVATLYFSTFRSVISQVPTATQLIPAQLAQSGTEAGAEPAAVYEYEPEESEILADLLPSNITFQIFRALLENQASFYGAQMSAMDNATRNAGEMINALTLNYNRTRQAMITTELIEIIAGAEAL
jgi:F-type H+-transporting ATPase subunit gamma